MIQVANYNLCNYINSLKMLRSQKELGLPSKLSNFLFKYSNSCLVHLEPSYSEGKGELSSDLRSASLEEPVSSYIQCFCWCYTERVTNHKFVCAFTCMFRCVFDKFKCDICDICTLTHQYKTKPDSEKIHRICLIKFLLSCMEYKLIVHAHVKQELQVNSC